VKKYFINVDLALLKSMNKSEGWYFISDSMGAHYGQIYIGMALEGSPNCSQQQNNLNNQNNDQ